MTVANRCGWVATMVSGVALAGCGDDAVQAQTDTTRDVVEVSDGELDGDAQGSADGDVAPLTGVVEGRWAMLETQTALVTTELLGTLEQESLNYYLVDLNAGTATATLCDWLTSDATDLATTRMGNAVLGKLTPLVRSYTVTEAGTGFDFATSEGLTLRGVQLAAPTTDAMPTMATDPRVVDQDGDGKAGITLVVQGTIAGELYVAHRHKATLAGALESDSRIAGLTAWTTEQTIFGSNPQLLADQKPRAITAPDARKSFFVMVKVGTSDDCAAIKTARDSLFPSED